MRPASVLALLLLLAAPAAGGQPATEQEKTLEGYLRSYRAVAEETLPSEEGLKKLQERYGSFWGGRKYRDQRLRLRRDIEDALDRITPIRDQYSKAHNLVNYFLQIRGSLLNPGKKTGESMGAETAKALYYDREFQELQAYELRLRELLEDDESIYETSLQMARRRRKETALWAGAAAAIAVLIALLFYFLRKRPAPSRRG